MRLIVFLLLTSFLVSCGEHPQEKMQLKNQIKVTQSVCTDTAGQAERIRSLSAFLAEHDTVLPDGNFLRYKLTEDESVLLYWGNSRFERVTSLEWSTARDIPTITDETMHFIVLQLGCGCPCWTETLLPLNETDSVQSFFMTIAIDKARDRIASLGDPIVGRDSLLITNAYTKQHCIIALDSMTFYSNPLENIEKIIFRKRGVYIRWFCRPGPNGDIEPKKEKFFPLKF